MRCAIWYYVHNLQNVKNNHGGVLILVKLTLLHGCFLRFLNCTNSTKSRNASHSFLKKSKAAAQSLWFGKFSWNLEQLVHQIYYISQTNDSFLNIQWHCSISWPFLFQKNVSWKIGRDGSDCNSHLFLNITKQEEETRSKENKIAIVILIIRHVKNTKPFVIDCFS